MDGKAESGEPASAFEPTGDVIGQRDLFPRDPEYHFARLDDNESPSLTWTLVVMSSNRASFVI